MDATPTLAPPYELQSLADAVLSDTGEEALGSSCMQVTIRAKSTFMPH